MVELNEYIKAYDLTKAYALVDEGCDRELKRTDLTLEKRKKYYELQIRNLKQWVEYLNEK